MSLSLLKHPRVQKRRTGLKQLKHFDEVVASALIQLIEDEPDRPTRLLAVKIFTQNSQHRSAQQVLNILQSRLQTQQHALFLKTLACLRLLNQLNDSDLVLAIKNHLLQWKAGQPDSNRTFRDYQGYFELKPNTLWAIGPIFSLHHLETLMQCLDLCLCEEEGEFISSRFRYLIIKLFKLSQTSESNCAQLYQVIRTERFFDVYINTLQILNEWQGLDTLLFWEAWLDRGYAVFFVEELMFDSFIKHFSEIQYRIVQMIISDNYSYYSPYLVEKTWNTSHWESWASVLQNLKGLEYFRLMAVLATVEKSGLQSNPIKQITTYQNILDEFPPVSG